MDLHEKEWFIQAPWGKLSIVAWGNCLDPPVLLCHGQVDSAASFRPLLRLLPRNFYYIGMELPGNGKSDPFPRGLMINAYDTVYALKVVVDHFRWTKFIYMAHSLGTLLGKLYNIGYPGQMSMVIDLDPTPAYEIFSADEFARWYHRFYTPFYNKYDKFNASTETAPKYTREKALDLLKRNRGLTGEAASNALERISRPVGEGLIRFTFDQRTKIITRPPFSSAHKEKLYTALDTPTLTIVADKSIRLGFYDNAPFALDEAAYPRRNYRVRKVIGNHDVHVLHPERLAKHVETFLLYGLEGLDGTAKAKL